jgi:hypothetical protein
MDEILDCYYGGLPETAGGFITEITGGMLADIIMNLQVDGGSDEQGHEILGGYDTDKLENAVGAGAGAGAGDDSDDELIILNNAGADATDVAGGGNDNDDLIEEPEDLTEELGAKTPVDIVNDKLPVSGGVGAGAVDAGAGAGDDGDLIDSEDELTIDISEKTPSVKGGGNVLMILVELIPTVFPKSYM